MLPMCILQQQCLRKLAFVNKAEFAFANNMRSCVFKNINRGLFNFTKKPSHTILFSYSSVVIVTTDKDYTRLRLKTMQNDPLLRFRIKTVLR